MLEGVKHFSDCMNALLNTSNEPLKWRQERDSFIKCCTKLVSASKELVPHTEISFEDLATGVAESISSGDFPEVLNAPKVEEAQPEPEQQEAPEEETA